jgi:hypothetical protein
MSSSLQLSSSTPNFQPIFEHALEEYKNKTGNDLTAHPLAAEINDCGSPNAILTVLEGKANELDQSWSSDERLSKLLIPTVTTLHALSVILDEGVGLVSYQRAASLPVFVLTMNLRYYPLPRSSFLRLVSSLL